MYNAGVQPRPSSVIPPTMPVGRRSYVVPRPRVNQAQAPVVNTQPRPATTLANNANSAAAVQTQPSKIKAFFSDPKRVQLIKITAIGGVLIVTVIVLLLIRHKLRKSAEARRRALSIQKKAEFEQKIQAEIEAEQRLLTAQELAKNPPKASSVRPQPKPPIPPPIPQTKVQPTVVPATFIHRPPQYFNPPVETIKPVQTTRVSSDVKPSKPTATKKSIKTASTTKKPKKVTSLKTNKPTQLVTEVADKPTESDNDKFTNMLHLEEVLTESQMKELEGRRKEQRAAMALNDLFANIMAIVEQEHKNQQEHQQEEQQQEPTPQNTAKLAMFLDGAVQDVVRATQSSMSEDTPLIKSDRVEELDVDENASEQVTDAEQEEQMEIVSVKLVQPEDGNMTDDETEHPHVLSVD